MYAVKKRGASRDTKKGLTQIDWIISLGIFLIFLAWFFVFAAPNLSFNKKTDSLAYLVETNLDSYHWNVNKIPLFISLNRSSGFNYYEPFIGKFPLQENFSYSFDGGRDYETIFGKVVFLANLTQQRNVVTVLKSKEKYDVTSGFYDLVADYSKVEIKKNNFIANLKKGYVDTLDFHGKNRIRLNDMMINGILMKNTLNYSSNRIYAYYHFSTNSFNFSQVFFANNPVVYNFFDTFDYFKNLFSVEISYALDNYPRFYINNSRFGVIDYVNMKCYNQTTKFITLYDDYDGLFYAFSRPVYVSVCARNETLNVRLKFNLSTEINYKYGFYLGSYENAFVYTDNPAYDVGIAEVLTGFDVSALGDFNYTSNEIKALWNFPEDSDFRIVIYDPLNKKYIFDYKTREVDATADVFSKEYNDYVLDKFGNRTKVIVTIMTW